jgi:hypothetical protein
VGVDGAEAVVVDAGRDDHAAERAASHAHRLPRRVGAGGHHARGRVQHAPAEATRERDAAGDGHLRAVDDDDVRRGAQAWAEVTEREPRVEEDHTGTDFTRQRVDPARQRRRRPEL